MAEDVSRLPKWAQNRIASLERQVAERDAKIGELTSVHPDTNVRISGWGSYPDMTLPADSEIDFYLGESRERYHNTLSVRVKRADREALYVSGSGGYLSIRPVASNVLEIRQERF